MALAKTEICDFGWKAADFLLKGVDDRSYSLSDVSGESGTLLMFICNHCPYVRGIISRLVSEVADIQRLGIGVAAIMSNDTDAYPEDSFDNMKRFAADNKFTFPYLIDPTQKTARTYDAVCTPDFFGFNNKNELQYRGRMDESRTSLVDGVRRDLFEAMKQIAETGQGPREQTASMGCSIKWRTAA